METRDKYREIFDKEMGAPVDNPVERLGNAMQAMQLEMIKDSPMWMRFNIISNMAARQDATNINWDKVNEILNYGTDQYDFNYFDEIKSVDQLSSSRWNCIAASEGLGVWRRVTCKDCGNTFYLNKGEVDFFKKKEFNVPKRCKTCRDIKSRKKPHGSIDQGVEGNFPHNKVKTSINDGGHQGDINKTGSEKTAMELAMEKAGLI